MSNRITDDAIAYNGTLHLPEKPREKVDKQHKSACGLVNAHDISYYTREKIEPTRNGNLVSSRAGPKTGSGRFESWYLYVYHPDRPHEAFDLCNSCFSSWDDFKQYAEKTIKLQNIDISNQEIGNINI